MKTKRLAVILIAVAFSIVVLFSCIGLFSLKKVQVTYAVGENTDTIAVQKALDSYIGKNLLFLDSEDVVNTLSDFHYMEITSIEKDYPNVLKLSVKERREVYDVIVGDTVYVTTENGFVLNSYSLSEMGQVHSRDKISLSFEGVNITDGAFGKTLITDSDDLVNMVFNMASSVNLTDCIKSITLKKATEVATAEFYTYTGVKIIVREILDDGVEKIITAFNKYDEGASDYEKTFKTIEVVKITQTGEIQAQWSDYQG